MLHLFMFSASFLLETLKLAKQLPRKLWLLVLSLSKPPRTVGNRTGLQGVVHMLSNLLTT